MKRYFNQLALTSCLLIASILLFGKLSIAQTNMPKLDDIYPAGNLGEENIPDFAPPPGATAPNFRRILIPWTKTPLESQVTAGSSAALVTVSTTFTDGSNNPIEIVNRLPIGGIDNFVVQPFDPRITAGSAISLLPYARTQDYSTTPVPQYLFSTISQQKGYYNNAFPYEGFTSYSAKRSISDANSRGYKTLLAGKSQVGQNRGTTTKSITNDASSIMVWSLDGNEKPICKAYYAPNELFGDIIISSSNEQLQSFTDKDGHMIYKEAIVSRSPLKVAGTYHVYDDMGHLRYTLPPKAVQVATIGATISDDILNNLCFSFSYDNRSRLSSIHYPAQQGDNYIVYDRFGRAVMKQTPGERVQEKWEVVYLDKLGRTLGTSLLNSSQGRAYWQQRLDNPPAGLTITDLEYFLATDEGDGKCPAEHAIADNEMMSYSWYDVYSSTLDADGNLYNQFSAEQAFASDVLNTPEAEFPARSGRQQLTLTGEKVRVLKSAHGGENLGDWRHSVYYYDDHGRQIGAVVLDKSDADGPTNFRSAHFISSQYDFSGRQILTKHTVFNPDERGVLTKHTELFKNEYVAGTNLFKKSSHKIDGGSWSLLSQFEYDKLGNTSRHILGNYGEVQDLSYNIRGQVTGINAYYAETGNKQGESRTFGQSIKYDYGFSNTRLDNKISGTIWRGAGGTNASPMAYGYSYDDMGRMSRADFTTLSGGLWNNINLDYSVSNVSYDISGNLLSMKQRGMVEDNGVIVPRDIDRLNYTYNANSHQLNSVLDTITVNYKVGDFVDRNTSGADYDYDANGNITRDRNKQIKQIEYNYLNKPALVILEDGKRMEFSYDAMGNRLEQLIIENGNTQRIDNIGNFVYRNDSLQHIMTSEGRTVYNAVDTSMREEFFVKDYLGNVRSVVDVVSLNLFNYLATFEYASANLEGLFFEHITDVREVKPGSIDPGDRSAAMLNGGDSKRRLGAAILMKVMAGDKIELNVNSFYESFNPEHDQPIGADAMLGSIISTLTSGAGGFVGSESHNTKLVSELFTPSNYLNSFTEIVNATADPERPKAHLNYLLFDERMQLNKTFSGAFQATGDGVWTEIGTQAPLEIPQNGYMAVYLDNLSSLNVFFDLVAVRLYRGQLKEEVHYYPYGLPMSNIGSAAAGFMTNNYRYQGNENFADQRVDIMDFDNRQYDAQLGRFMNTDPLAINSDILTPYTAMDGNPVSTIDPEGLQGQDALDVMLDNWLPGWHFWLDEVVIYGNGKTGSIPNLGGGNSPFAPYAPGGGTGGGAIGGTTAQFNNAGGGGSGSGGSPASNRLPGGSDTRGTETESAGGSPDGVAQEGNLDGFKANLPGKNASLTGAIPVAVGTGIAEGAGIAAATPIALAAAAAVITYYGTAALRRQSEKVYVTYIKRGPNGEVYVGRTSGYGTPDELVKQRDRTHHIKGFSDGVVDRWAQGTELVGGLHGTSAVDAATAVSAYSIIRGREQQLMDYYQLQGNSMANKIRGVSKVNPLGQMYHAASTLRFGEIAPFTGVKFFGY